MLVYGRAPAICGVFVPKPDLERMSHIAQTTVKTQMPESANKLSAMTKTRLIPLSNIAKRVISDKKQSARTEKSVNIGKKNYTNV